ncbi:bifunctional methylenetetrahydrofolate dehydrogenase/methenyltetrahydrofolate cyclohydrolase FolD [Magnetospirillum sp. UT-4]|uniref:bifunctional methylenetetrahydrofolate dehydrogenase/methenyltetrahydrofolate cyclohydrolase FolD n=1 Tax=Magnetospirillum sp. UT-4 TaxID=2681467 RepID=UPI00137FB747|nr:bifunctional methylenetetrahydrofolate dehydrogenase/methenyltetrahydrofolate cyclohydrolase FolD [Magnetospirillum sp. UT-4]CAA7619227.1 bifunctional 5,10-methylene-tetrahydrofolate dehydrogenase and 5,10-methylene-tetrahydrofolate cyclohydrolase [Magnetospirillum sp. UT-4]
MTSAKLIDGNAFSAGLRDEIAARVREIRDEHHVTPGLAVVLVGEDPASQVYVRNKNKRAMECGMDSFEHILPADTPEHHVLNLIEGLNDDPAVHGILVQLPLPRHIDSQKVIEAIRPDKDVDGFHPWNVGKLASGGIGLIPCTPLGSLMMLRDHLGPLAGMKAIVVGRSNIVGKPMAHLLIRESCTVTVAHSQTRDLPAEVRAADIVVAAVGRPEMIRGDWIKPGATVIDVGINRVVDHQTGKNKLVGDVAFAEAVQVAGAITPVPGGVGPMTIACLLRNTLTAAARLHRLDIPEAHPWA